MEIQQVQEAFENDLRRCRGNKDIEAFAKNYVTLLNNVTIDISSYRKLDSEERDIVISLYGKLRDLDKGKFKVGY